MNSDQQRPEGGEKLPVTESAPEWWQAWRQMCQESRERMREIEKFQDIRPGREIVKKGKRK